MGEGIVSCEGKVEQSSNARARKNEVSKTVGEARQ
jgi:hypothetical protein